MSTGNAFCSKCGSPIVPGSAFCSKCGAPVASTAQAPQAPLSWREQRRMWRDQWKGERHQRHEKSEKHEKAEKSEKQEKGAGGMGGALIGGAVLIWLGLSVYLQQAGVISSSNLGAYFLFGLGAILVADGLLRSLQGSRAYSGVIIGGAVLMFLGLAVIESSWQTFWPFILVVLGLAVILGGFSARRRSPTP